MIHLQKCGSDREVQWAGEWTWRRGDSGDTASGGICSGDIVRVGNRAYSKREQIEFIEMPKRLYFETYQARDASCILPVQTGIDGLTGKGILVGIVDSGVDFFHPDFRNEDGSSRILRLWDQSGNENPPEGYTRGTEYTKEEIDKALALGEIEGRRLIPSRDFSGHGTAVLGIAAGNGRASDGVNRGVAYESDLIVVKMGNAGENSFPRTTELMEGIDYLVWQAVKMRRAIAINISFGNNYGSHRGDSLVKLIWILCPAWEKM